MELQNQIKRYRTMRKMSQEELSEKVFVTRQTVSNWENGKSYPDIHSLLLLSSLIEKRHEKKKTPYQTVLKLLFGATLGVVITAIMSWILGGF